MALLPRIITILFKGRASKEVTVWMLGLSSLEGKWVCYMWKKEMSSEQKIQVLPYISQHCCNQVRSKEFWSFVSKSDASNSCCVIMLPLPIVERLDSFWTSCQPAQNWYFKKCMYVLKACKILNMIQVWRGKQFGII